MLPISPALKKQILGPLILPRNTTVAVMFSTFFSKALASCSQPLPYTFFLQKLSESSCADWSRAMVYESIDHGNDITCHAMPVVLFLVFRKK